MIDPFSLSYRAILGTYKPEIPMPEIDCIKVVTLDESYAEAYPDIWIQHNISSAKSGRQYKKEYKRIYHSGRPWIVVEEPAFRFNHHLVNYYRWSWFSYYYNDGIHFHKDCPGDRWQRIQEEQQIEIYPWESRGDNILFLMQRPRDSSLRPMEDQYGSYSNFVEWALTEIRKKTDRPIRVRLHPLRIDQQLEFLIPIMNNIENCKISDYSPVTVTGVQPLSGGESLYRDLDTAWAAVGANSNSLIESVCYGIPSWALDRSAMASPVTHKKLDLLNDPIGFDRKQWLHNMGYSQWRIDEIKKGDPLVHLMQWWPEVQTIRKKRKDWWLLQEKLRYYNSNLNSYIVDGVSRPNIKGFKAHMHRVTEKLTNKELKRRNRLNDS